jgi:hypothetical protein
MILSLLLIAISGYEHSSVRAGLALLLGIFASRLERKLGFLNCIVTSLFILCCIDSEAWSDPGVHLTYAALFGIWIGARASLESTKIIAALKVSLICTLFTATVGALWFDSVSLIGLLLNPLLATPLSVLVIPGGIVAVSLIFCGLDPHGLLLKLIQFLLGKFACYVNFLADIPGASLKLTAQNKFIVVGALISIIVALLIPPGKKA